MDVVEIMVVERTGGMTETVRYLIANGADYCVAEEKRYLCNDPDPVRCSPHMDCEHIGP